VGWRSWLWRSDDFAQGASPLGELLDTFQRRSRELLFAFPIFLRHRFEADTLVAGVGAIVVTFPVPNLARDAIGEGRARKVASADAVTALTADRT
jgi:hypothetical protein